MSLPKFYLITRDPSPEEPKIGGSHTEQCRSAIASGVRLIQLRSKSMDAESRNDLIAASDLCRQHGVTYIINDDVELTKETNASGVHLGLSDSPPEQARAVLGPNSLIGVTVNKESDITAERFLAADYIGLGPWGQTNTKTHSNPLLGLSGTRTLIEKINLI